VSFLTISWEIPRISISSFRFYAMQWVSSKDDGVLRVLEDPLKVLLKNHLRVPSKDLLGVPLEDHQKVRLEVSPRAPEEAHPQIPLDDHPKVPAKVELVKHSRNNLKTSKNCWKF
jgi:hypothetical protein